MRTRVIRNNLFENLRERILSGKYPAGYRFPNEPELAVAFGVARGTLRTALKELEKENLIVRRVREGTFVKDFRSRNNSVMYYLLPCADYMVKSGFASNYTHMRVISSALRIASKSDIQLILLPVSPTNSADDIDFNTLKSIPQGARILLSSSKWYEKVFPYLHQHGCRVAATESDFDTIQELSSYGWMVYNTDGSTVFYKALEKFLENGRRRILIASKNIDDNTRINIKESFARAGLDCKDENILLLDGNSSDTRTALAKRYSEFKFNGLFFYYPELQLERRKTLNADLHLPSDTMIIAQEQASYYSELEYPVPHFVFDFISIAHDATKWLLSDNKPGVIRVETSYFTTPQ